MNSNTPVGTAAVQRKATENMFEKPSKIIRDELSSAENSQVCYMCSSKINVQRMKKKLNQLFQPL